MKKGVSAFFALLLFFSSPQVVHAKSTVVLAARTPILMYHMVIEFGPGTSEMNRKISLTPKQFEQQMAYLAQQGFQTLFMRELADNIQKKKVTRRRTVALTFDDGTVDFYETVFPLLQRYKFKATVFANPEFNGTNDRMTHAMLRELHESGLVEVAAHTLSHVNLTELSTQSAAREILDGKITLEHITGVPVYSFAYPFGAYSATVIKMIKQTGFASAVIADERSVLREEKMFTLPRRMVGAGDSMSSFVAKLRPR